MKRLFVIIAMVIAPAMTFAQYMLKDSYKAEETPDSPELKWLESIYPPTKIGEVNIGETFLFKESMLNEGESDVPQWLIGFTYYVKDVNDAKWFNGKELTLTKISNKKPKGSSLKCIVWELSTSDGHKFEFETGSSQEELNERYSVLARKFDMVSKSDILYFNNNLSGLKVFTNRMPMWTFVNKIGTVPQYIPVILDSCYVGRGNNQYRVTAITENGERIVASCDLRLFDEDPALYKLRSFANFILLNNPRENYPAISDEHWNLIQNGKIRAGMTRSECELSWGTPDKVRQTIDNEFPTILVYGKHRVILDSNETISKIYD